MSRRIISSNSHFAVVGIFFGAFVALFILRYRTVTLSDLLILSLYLSMAYAFAFLAAGLLITGIALTVSRYSRGERSAVFLADLTRTIPYFIAVFMPLNMYVHIYVLPGSAWLVSLGNLTNIIFILAWGIIFALLFGVVRSPRFPHPAILSIIGMGIVLLIFSLGGSGHEIPTTQKVLPIKPSEGTSPVAGRKVILLGLDGVNQRVLNRLFEQADLPNLQAMFNRGISSPLETVTPTFSPLIWTTIASGLPGRNTALVLSLGRPFLVLTHRLIWQVFRS